MPTNRSTDTDKRKEYLRKKQHVINERIHGIRRSIFGKGQGSFEVARELYEENCRMYWANKREDKFLSQAYSGLNRETYLQDLRVAAYDLRNAAEYEEQSLGHDAQLHAFAVAIHTICENREYRPSPDGERAPNCATPMPFRSEDSQPLSPPIPPPSTSAPTQGKKAFHHQPLRPPSTLYVPPHLRVPTATTTLATASSWKGAQVKMRHNKK